MSLRKYLYLRPERETESYRASGTAWPAVGAMPALVPIDYFRPLAIVDSRGHFKNISRTVIDARAASLAMAAMHATLGFQYGLFPRQSEIQFGQRFGASVRCFRLRFGTTVLGDAVYFFKGNNVGRRIRAKLVSAFQHIVFIKDIHARVLASEKSVSRERRPSAVAYGPGDGSRAADTSPAAKTPSALVFWVLSATIQPLGPSSTSPGFKKDRSGFIPTVKITVSHGIS